MPNRLHHIYTMLLKSKVSTILHCKIYWMKSGADKVHSSYHKLSPDQFALLELKLRIRMKNKNWKSKKFEPLFIFWQFIAYPLQSRWILVFWHPSLKLFCWGWVVFFIAKIPLIVMCDCNYMYAAMMFCHKLSQEMWLYTNIIKINPNLSGRAFLTAKLLENFRNT